MNSIDLLKNASTSKGNVSPVAGSHRVRLKRLARSVARTCAVAIILWLAIRAVNIMAVRILRRVITGRAV